MKYFIYIYHEFVGYKRILQNTFPSRKPILWLQMRSGIVGVIQTFGSSSLQCIQSYPPWRDLSSIFVVPPGHVLHDLQKLLVCIRTWQRELRQDLQGNEVAQDSPRYVDWVCFNKVPATPAMPSMHIQLQRYKGQSPNPIGLGPISSFNELRQTVLRTRKHKKNHGGQWVHINWGNASLDHVNALEVDYTSLEGGIQLMWRQSKVMKR